MKNKKQSRTIIAAVKTRRGKILMAGDRRVSCDWGYAYVCPKPKIRKTDAGLLVGGSGDSGLCKLLVDIFEPAEIRTDAQTYMFYTFLPQLNKFLKQQPGYVNEHKLLTLGNNEHCCLLVACLGELYTVDVQGVIASEDVILSRITVDDAPIPYAIGCGSEALKVLELRLKETGYSTKEHLIEAVEVACQTSPGCGLPLDIVSE